LLKSLFVRPLVTAVLVRRSLLHPDVELERRLDGDALSFYLGGVLAGLPEFEGFFRDDVTVVEAPEDTVKNP
jgi:hypothetical protein